MPQPPHSGSAVLRRAISRHRVRLILSSGALGLHQVCEAAVPVLIGMIVDRAIVTDDRSALILWIGVLALLFLTLSQMWRSGARWLVTAKAEESRRLREELAERLLDPRGEDVTGGAGEMVSISGSDADNTAELLTLIPAIVAMGVATITSAVILLTIHPGLGSAVLVVTVVVMLVLQRGIPLLMQRAEHHQESAGKASTMATDLVAGIRPLRGLGGQRTAAARYRQVSRTSLAAALHKARGVSGFGVVSESVSNLLAAGVAIAAGWLALNGSLSIGGFVTVVGVSQFMIAPLVTLTGLPAMIGTSRGSANRVARVLAAEPRWPSPAGRSDTSQRVADAPAGLVVRDLRCGGLAGLDLALQPGELLGVVATRTADAEALIGAVSGREPVDPDQGSVLLDGVDLLRLGPAQARLRVLAEPHQADLFSGTLAANLLAARSVDPAQGRLEDSLTAAAADDVVASHPAGLTAGVLERGRSLSGGQRQRIALARALHRRTPVLVLHDPTTAIDAVTEQGIAEGVRRIRHGDEATRSDFSTLVVTSSPALLAQADRVVLIDRGQVAAQGTHAELSRSHPRYQEVVLR